MAGGFETLPYSIYDFQTEEGANCLAFKFLILPKVLQLKDKDFDTFGFSNLFGIWYLELGIFRSVSI